MTYKLQTAGMLLQPSTSVGLWSNLFAQNWQFKA